MFILDTIGLLNKAYSYADIAYVGGAMGKTGLHNILEPAIFGVPILIGKNYSKFPEAFDMIDNGGVFSIANIDLLTTNLNRLINDTDFRKTTGSKNLDFITKNKGATTTVMTYLQQ